MNGPSIVNNQSVATISFDWHNQGLGDFNADGHSDVLWRHSLRPGGDVADGRRHHHVQHRGG